MCCIRTFVRLGLDETDMAKSSPSRPSPDTRVKRGAEVGKTNYQPNDLVMAQQPFSALEKRIFLLVVDRLRPTVNVAQDLFQDTTVRIPNVRWALGQPSYNRLKEACRSLSRRQISYLNDQKKAFKFITPFPVVSYRDNTLELVIYKDVMPYFLELKNGYTSYQLNEALALSSIYAQRLYEMLNRWKGLGRWTISIADLRLHLALENKYANWKDLNQRVLKTAYKEINEKTKLRFDYVAIKRGRTYEQVTFCIERKRPFASKSDKAKTEQDERLLAELKKLNIVRPDYQKLIVEYHSKTFWKWLYEYKKEGCTYKNPGGHLLKTLGIVS